MELDTQLTVRRVDAGAAGTDTALPRAEIVISGRGSGKFVAGAVLEAAVRWRTRRLLFLTDDVPHEEMLSVVLLDEHFDVLDHATIGGPYTTGSFSALALDEPDAVSFRFIGDTTWRIELLPRPGFRMPFVGEPRGVWREPGFSRHFIVRGSPEPQRA